MAFLNANRMAQTLKGMGSVSRNVFKAGKYGLDKALSSKVAMVGVMAGGTALYANTRNSNSSIMRGIGNIGLIAAGTTGIAGASRGMMGRTAQSYTGMGINTAKAYGERALDVGLGVASMASSRMRRY